MKQSPLCAPGLHSRVRFLFENILDFVYPPECVSCGKQGAHWCSTCRLNVSASTKIICLRCYNKISAVESCGRCGGTVGSFLGAAALEYAGNIRRPILHLKYRPNRRLALSLAELLVKRFEELDWRVDIITAVPLGPDRLRQRGYSQAELLAEALAAKLRLPFWPDIIRRSIETRSQVGLGAEARMTNVAGAFRADHDKAAGRRVLVVDDLLTTGSTLSACAQVLHLVGAEGIVGLAVASASTSHVTKKTSNSL